MPFSVTGIAKPNNIKGLRVILVVSMYSPFIVTFRASLWLAYLPVTHCVVQYISCRGLYRKLFCIPLVSAGDGLFPHTGFSIDIPGSNPMRQHASLPVVLPNPVNVVVPVLNRILSFAYFAKIEPTVTHFRVRVELT